MNTHGDWRNLAKRVVACFVVGLVMACTPASQSHDDPAPAFRDALEAHLGAVAWRDIDALLPTLTRGNDLTMIGPDGGKLDTREQYVDFHRRWFAADDHGRFEFEIVRLVESARLAQALVRYRYSATGATGAHESVARLSLTFALEDGACGLVFDQNTRIAPTEAP